MALTFKNGQWTDGVSGSPLAAFPSAILPGNNTGPDGIECSLNVSTAFVQNWPAVQKAREDTIAMTWTSAKTAAPAIGAVQADTGALAAGNYDFDIQLVASDTVAVGKGLVIEHRNAANGATLNSLGGIPAGVSQQVTLRNYAIATNERIRVIAGTVAGATSSMYVSAIGRRVS